MNEQQHQQGTPSFEEFLRMEEQGAAASVKEAVPLTPPSPPDAIPPSFEMPPLPEVAPAEAPAQPAEAPAQPTEAPAEESSPIFDASLFGKAAKDLGTQAMGAVQDVAVGFARTGAAISRAAGLDIGDVNQNPLELPEPQSIVSGLGRDIVRFGIGYLTGKKVVGATETVAQRMAAISIGSTITSDPGAPNISNILQGYGIGQDNSLTKAVTDFLAVKKDDSVLAGKLKHAIDDVLTEGIGEVLYWTLKATKAKVAGNVKGEAEATTELEKAVQKAEEEIESGKVLGTTKPANPAEEKTILNTSPTAAPKATQFDEATNTLTTPEVTVTPEAAAVAPTPPPFTLPKGLEKSSPRFGQYELAFESDLDRAAYIIANDAKGASRAAKKFEAELEAQGYTIDEIRRHGMEVKANIKSSLSTGQVPEGPFTVPEYGFTGTRKLATESEKFVETLPHASKEVFKQLDEGKQNLVRLKAEEARKENPKAIVRLTHTQEGNVNMSISKPITKEVVDFEGKQIFAMTEDMEKQFDASMTEAMRSYNFDVMVEPLSNMLNWRNLSSPYEIHKTVDTVGTLLQSKYTQLSDVRRWEETKKFAKMFDTDVEALHAKLAALYHNDLGRVDSYILAARSVTLTLAREAVKLKNLELAGQLGEQGMVDLLRVQDLLVEMASLTKVTSKSLARGLQAMRMVAKPTMLEAEVSQFLKKGGQESAKTLIDNLAKVRPDELDKAVKIAVLTRKAEQGFWPMFTEYYLNALLSGPATSAKNIFSGLIEAVYTPGMHYIGGITDPVQRRDAALTYVGLWKHLGDSWEMANRSLKEERSILDVGKDSQAMEQLNKSIVHSAFGLEEGTTLAKAIDKVGSLVRMPGRFLRSQDEFLKQANYRAKAYQKSWAEALDQLDAGKLKSMDEAAQYAQARFNSMFDYVELPEGSAVRTRVQGETNKLRQEAGIDQDTLGYARSQSFTTPVDKIETWGGLKSLGQSFQTFSNSHPVLKVGLLPFTTVPTNLIRRGVANSPFAPIYKQFWSDLKQGGETAAVAKGRFLTASAMAAGIVMAVANGRVTGMVFDEEGNQDTRRSYALVYFNDKGEKQYLTYKNLDWIGMPMGVIADAITVMQHMKQEGAAPAETQDIMAAATLAMARNLSSKAYLQGMTETMTALFGEKADQNNLIVRLINQKAGSLVPSIVNTFSGDELRKVRTPLDAMLARTPFSGMVEPKRDFTGEIKQKPGYPYQQIWAIHPVSGAKDEVHAELQRLQDSPAKHKFVSPVTPKVGNVDLFQWKNTDGQSAYDRWGEILATKEKGGKTFRQALDELFKSDKYQNRMHDGVEDYASDNRALAIDRIKKEYKDFTLKELKREFPGLDEAIKADEKMKRRMKYSSEAPSSEELDATRAIIQQGQ